MAVNGKVRVHGSIKDAYVGMKVLANNGQYMRITAISNGKVSVQFDDCGIRDDVTYAHFINGEVANYNKSGKAKTGYIADKTGEVRVNNIGQKMKIIGGINSHDINVQFEDRTIVRHTGIKEFNRGAIANPNAPREKMFRDKEYYWFTVIKLAYKESDTGYPNFICKCNRCNNEFIMTANEMMRHKKACRTAELRSIKRMEK